MGPSLDFVSQASNFLLNIDQTNRGSLESGETAQL